MMKNSYKIALIVAMVLCAAAFGYYLFWGGKEGTPSSKVSSTPPPSRLSQPLAARSPAGAGLSVSSAVKPESTPVGSGADLGGVPGGVAAGGPVGEMGVSAQAGYVSSRQVGPVVGDEGSGYSGYAGAGSAGLPSTEPARPLSSGAVATGGSATGTSSESPFVVTSSVGRSAVAGASPPAGIVMAANPAPRTPPPPTTARRAYRVEAGDTFSSIALMLYGSERRWIDIAQANPAADPTRLRVGQVLQLPSWAEIQAAQKPQATPLGSGQSTSHIVRPGETLSSISGRYYRSPEHWAVIFDANRARIGSNPDNIAAGMVLKIPSRP